MERIRVETGVRAPTATGIAWASSGTETRWCDAVPVPSERAERYQSIDGRVDYEFRFNDWPTIGMGTTRFVWETNGHPNRLKIYTPVKPPTKLQGQRRRMIVLVRDTDTAASS